MLPGGDGDLWTLDFARGVRTRLTFRQSAGSYAVWSPDGSRIAFAAGNNLDTLYEKASSGAGEEKELLKEPGRTHYPTSWSRDGRFLLYYVGNAPKTGTDLWVLPLEGDRKPVLLLGTEFNECRRPVFRPICAGSPTLPMSPAGTKSMSARSWFRDLPEHLLWAMGNGRSRRTAGASPDGVRMERRSSSRLLPTEESKMAVDVKANGAAFLAGVPHRLFQAPIDYGWDVTADGKRFLWSFRRFNKAARYPSP